MLYLLGMCSGDHQQYRQRLTVYIWLERCHAGYITKKVAIHVVTVYHAAYILLTVHRTDAVCVVQSTITVQPQAHPTMLLASV